MTTVEKSRICRRSIFVFCAGCSIEAVFYVVWAIWRIQIVNGVLLLLLSFPWSSPYVYYGHTLFGNAVRYWLNPIVLSIGFSLNCTMVYAAFAVVRAWERGSAGRQQIQIADSKRV